MATQLLLIEDVLDVGRSGDIVKVKSGYSRNFLIPKGLAVPADKNALRRQKALQEVRAKRAAEDHKTSEKIASTLDGKTFSVTVKVDANKHMYGSVSANDIKALVEKEEEVVLEKRGVQLPHPIKRLGVHSIVLKLPEGVMATIELKVLGEGVVEEEESEAEGEVEATDADATEASQEAKAEEATEE